MAHWGKTPSEVRELSEGDLEAMEYAFLLLEKRQSETFETLLGATLGTTWDVDNLLSVKKDTQKKNETVEPFTWALRKKPEKVFSPLVLFLTQNPKLMQQLQGMATDVRNQLRKDPSILNVPQWYEKMDKNTVELVDLGALPKEQFLQWAGSIH